MDEKGVTAPEHRKHSLAVVVPCFNAGPYLLEAIASIFEEDLADVLVSVVVVDDHSDDAETLDALGRLEAQNTLPLRVIRNKGRRGVSAARNLGVRESSGRWIAFLDADDALIPGGLRSRLRVAEQYPSAEWIGGDFVIFDAKGDVRGEPFLRSHTGPQRHLQQAFGSGHVQILHRPAGQFLDTLLTHTDCALLTRELFERVGGFNEQLQTAEDYHLWLRLAAETDFYFVPAVVAKYRRHELSLTHAKPPGAMRMGALRLLRDDPRLGSMRRSVEAKILESYLKDVRFHRTEGRFSSALLSALGALKLRPLSARVWRSLAAAAARRN